MKLFETFSRGLLDQIGRPVADEMFAIRPRWTVGSISEYDAAFFAGLVTVLKPEKLVEVGVASGWGSVILLRSLAALPGHEFQYHGVDIADRFFYDARYATGQAVGEMLPHHLPRYNLITGKSIAQVAGSIGGGLDFAFIDAHHMHPWATLDLLAVLPFMRPKAWVALHDIGLSLKDGQDNQNRGPKYLFEGWQDDRACSIQVPSMAGAIQLGANPAGHLPLLMDILRTPWEMPVEQHFLDPLVVLLEEHYGAEWGGKFRRTFEICNYHVNKMHSPSIDTLSAEIGRLQGVVSAYRSGLCSLLNTLE